VHDNNEVFEAYITDIQITTIAVCAALFVGCVAFMKYSRIGRNIRAVASNTELSNIVGIASDRVILWAFAIGSSLGQRCGGGISCLPARSAAVCRYAECYCCQYEADYLWGDIDMGDG
jgi:branched-subunit amino acid ABC-type transport system permease component